MKIIWITHLELKKGKKRMEDQELEGIEDVKKEWKREM